MPTMDEIIGNLGEPLEFEEYYIDEDDVHDELTGTSTGPQSLKSAIMTPHSPLNFDAACCSSGGKHDVDV